MRYLFAMLCLYFVAACTLEQTQEEKEADMIGITENKIGWSASGTLTHKNELNTVSLQANFSDAKNYTAQFKVTGDLRNKQAVAEITWSVEGNFIRRLVSVADGVSVQGAGQAISIKIRDVSSFPLIPGSSADYLVTVSVVPGTRGSTSNPPTYNGGYYIVADANTKDVAVPDNAGVISVAALIGTGIPGTPIAENSVMIAQMDSGGNVLARYDPREFFWAPLLPGCSKVTVINTSGADITLTVIFGIDG